MLRPWAPRPEDEQGITVAEVVVAATILLMASAAFGRVSAAAIVAQDRATARDRALTAAYDIIDALHVEGCLLLTGAETDSDHDAVSDRCLSNLLLAGAIGTGGGAVTGAAGRYEFTYTSRWVVGAATAAPTRCDDPGYANRPSGVEHTVDVGYRERAAVRSRVRSTGVQAVAPDGYQHRSWQRSNLVVATGDPSAVVELIGISGHAIGRAADPNGCVWLPALRTGSYRLTAKGAGGERRTTVDMVAEPRATTPKVVEL